MTHSVQHTLIPTVLNKGVRSCRGACLTLDRLIVDFAVDVFEKLERLRIV